MARLAVLRWGGAMLLAAAGSVLAATPAGAVQIGSAPCPSPQALPGGTRLTLCSQGSFVDDAGQTNVLGFVRNDGPLIETPQMTVAVTSTDGSTRTQTAYSPLVGLATGASTPIDAQVSGAVASFQIVGLGGVAPQYEPEDAFTLTGVTVGTRSSSPLISGTVVNNTGRTVIGVKLGYVAFTTGGAIAYYAPDIRQGPHQTIAAGESTPFAMYARAVPANAVISADLPFLFAQGNEPGTALPTAPAPVASARSPVPVTRTIPTRTTPKSHTVVVNPEPVAGIRAPTAQDLAEAANPPTVTPSHDARPVRRAAGPLPALIDASPAAARSGPGTIQWAGPLALLLVLGLLAARMLGRDAAVAREARSDRRLRRTSARTGGETLDPEYAPPVSRRR